MCFAPQRRALFRHPNLQKWREHVVFCTFWLRNVLRATTACTFSTSQLPQVVRQWCALYILTWKCASRHNRVHFFDIATSKSGPTLVCFVHFDLEMCFAPQRRALFRHRSFQKRSEAEVFCTFWLANVLRAISHLASWLRTRRFSEPTFRPSGAPNHWKNTVFRDFPTFSRISIFFLLTLSLLLFFLLIFLFSLPLPCSAFHLSILSEVWLLNFLRKLVSIMIKSNFNNLQYLSFEHTHTQTHTHNGQSSVCVFEAYCSYNAEGTCISWGLKLQANSNGFQYKIYSL